MLITIEPAKLPTCLEDWKEINTADDLRAVLIIAASTLPEALKKRWTARVENMPAVMDKEAINFILFCACQEIYAR